MLLKDCHSWSNRRQASESPHVSAVASVSGRKEDSFSNLQELVNMYSNANFEARHPSLVCVCSSPPGFPLISGLIRLINFMSVACDCSRLIMTWRS